MSDVQSLCKLSYAAMVVIHTRARYIALGNAVASYWQTIDFLPNKAKSLGAFEWNQTAASIHDGWIVAVR